MPKKAMKPPQHLSEPTGRWWCEVMADYELEGHHVRLLTLACEAWDRCAQAREAIAQYGLLIPTGGEGFKANPAVAIERDARLAFARLVRELDLDTEAPRDSRPPPLRSNRR